MTKHLDEFANFIYRKCFGYTTTPSINPQACAMRIKCFNKSVAWGKNSTLQWCDPLRLAVWCALRDNCIYCHQ